MGIDYSALAHPKGTLRVERKRQKRLTDDECERHARAAVRHRDGRRCAVPGCREHGSHLHHIVYRSRSRTLRWATANLCFLCPAHHALEHAGKITISGNADEHLTITGAKEYLEFKL
jgi:5-methylcytosine-specific restriction endonuclease McrA